MIALVLALAGAAQRGLTPSAAWAQDSTCAAMHRGSRADSTDAPPASVNFSVGGSPVSICYSRPLASRDLPTLGTSALPYGVVWRTGGSTPAVIQTSRRISIMGLHVPQGRYVLYTVPGEHDWQLVINRSVNDWADGPTYNATQRATEVGRVAVAAEETRQFVERLTLSAVAAGPNAVLMLEWQRTQVAIPITPD